MKKLWQYISEHQRRLSLTLLAGAILATLLLYRLGSLVGGLSANEFKVVQASYGWHGMFHHPLNLPLQVLRSIAFFGVKHHGQTLSRLPEVVVGGLAVLSFAWLLRQWHGARTAWFATALFACSAWTLHASRLASNDVLYLAAVPLLLASHVALQQHTKRMWAWYGSLITWGVLLYVPGLIWLILIELWWHRPAIALSWRHFARFWQRALYVLLGVVWLPLLIIDLLRQGQLRYWLGLPTRWPTVTHYLKQLAGVPIHLLVRGPENSNLWLGKAPILDIFSLVVCLIGIYFYARHWRASRSRLLASYLVPGIVLVSLGGAVSLSLLVPLLYIAAATGIAYLLREWLQVFPYNPLARGLGIGLIAVAIAISCTYNLRAYFVAWPHDPTTVSTFRYHR